MNKKKELERICFRLLQQNSHRILINQNSSKVVEQVIHSKTLNSITMIYFVLKKRVFILLLLLLIYFDSLVKDEI